MLLLVFLVFYQFNKELKEWTKIRYELNEKIKKIEIKTYQINKENELEYLLKSFKNLNLELNRQK